MSEMAEMTVQFMVQHLRYGHSGFCLNAGSDNAKAIADKLEQLAAEISKKDKSIQLAAKELSEYGRCCPDCIDEGGCEYDAKTLAKCYENWLAWLERGPALEKQKTATSAAVDPS